MEKSIVDDMHQLCASILSKRGKYAGYHAYGFDYLPISQVKTKNGFIYKYSETPIALESLGIITLSDQILQLPDEEDIDIKSDGYLSIEFHFAKADAWLKKEISDIIITLPEGWKWYDKKKAEYQFGTLGNFKQIGKIRKKVFVELMELYMQSPQGVSIESLHQRTNIGKSRLRIEINAISEKLSTQIGIYFKSERKGYYYLIFGKKLLLSTKNEANN